MATEMKDYKSTLSLPRTGFPMKGNLPRREPDRVASWDSEGVYEKMVASVEDAIPRFILHDGPPYANGHIHQGTILNKVLKDFVIKHRNMAGWRAPFVPGWDCHGLPIELAVDKELGRKKREMSSIEIRRACRAFAKKWVSIQREEFKRLGVLGRWEEPYLTMTPQYEATVVRELARIAEAGGLYQGKKPVYWCRRCVTALAEAEIEYDDHVSPSIYVSMDVVSGLESLPEAVRGAKPALVIWTTTPWTLPANLAIAVSGDIEYVAYSLKGRAIIVAKSLLGRFLAECAPEELKSEVPCEEVGELDPSELLSDSRKILARLSASDLLALTYRHPLVERESPVLEAEYVTTEQGTGLVHTAPGHGAEDYILGQRCGLETYNPVDDHGRFIEDLPESLAFLRGIDVYEANPLILDRLAEAGALLSPKDLSVSHSYPHCWRCGEPIVFRATVQWFVSMEQGDLRSRALKAIDEVEWIPAWGRDRIKGMIETRPDWCVSRQRTWGVPIPALVCEECETAIADPKFMREVADQFEERGADAWFEDDILELMEGLKCPSCNSGDLKRETDILDVWFESGVSYAAVAEKDPELGVPVDLYLEGSDQHRGWFHSTLLCAIGTGRSVPYRSVLTHGFVVDGEGKKLSKKKKNYTPPEKVLQTRGAEILRLWVAAEDYRGDVRYSDEILNRLSEAYRKIRNTLRFALGNLADFDQSSHSRPASDWSDLDRWAYGRLQSWIAKVREAYDGYSFHGVYRATMDFFAVDLSAVYFDVLKDRLYTSGPDWPERRAAQTVLWAVARDSCRVLAPILSFTSEEAWQVLREEHPEARLEESVFLAGLPEIDRSVSVPDFERLIEMRRHVMKKIEDARTAGTVGGSLTARVSITASGEDYRLLDERRGFLPEWFIVSQVDVSEGPEALKVEVQPARGEKCARCWQYTEERGTSSVHPEVCPRCTRAVIEMSD